ncbi:NAD(P)/FAD-dependent oxidoreductase [Ktedonospora formicarum]|uniref:FAD/NAD(P)-binding domain-containing protein n=1 Tax=Ktedonospora formicarum TaxID=2778364 RepID=A0A8J3MV08_9CHLR|nr:NAD(P)/FAD-dependent oxidoreductase [Ktedonospora formicarum]GHO48805.1 hypothetical protein KSX_69680 [Ktedonospora formicarum]
MENDMYDAIIVGAGPTGLSAALWLGRCRRRVLVCDTERPRNSASQALHGFLTRDGIAPAEFLRLGREQLAPYTTVELRTIAVTDAERVEEHFRVTLADHTQVETRKLLLATGVIDELPLLDGLEQFYGSSVFHCPYCDGWEWRDQPLALYGAGEHGRAMALQLRQWSHDLVLCTDGPAELDAADLALFSRLGIGVCEDRIAHLEGSAEQLERIVFRNGKVLARRALFVITHEHQHAPLAQRLGYRFSPNRLMLRTEGYEQPDIPGLFVAGNSVRNLWVIGAAAEGAEAAFLLNRSLLQEDLARERLALMPLS